MHTDLLQALHLSEQLCTVSQLSPYHPGRHLVHVDISLHVHMLLHLKQLSLKEKNPSLQSAHGFIWHMSLGHVLEHRSQSSEAHETQSSLSPQL